MTHIVRLRKYWFAFSLAMVLTSIAALSIWGLKPGIDFTGGSLLEYSFQQRPAIDELNDYLVKTGFPDLRIQPSDENGVMIRSRQLTEDEHKTLRESLIKQFGGETAVQELRYDAIGSVIGSELRNKAYLSIVLVLVAIIFFIAYAFRKVSQPISSFVYGLVAVAALFHDIIIVAGIYAFLGYFLNVEIDVLFISALLTILGFSVHDTIVVFDRIREKLMKNRSMAFAEVVESSIQETFVRSINTSSTTVFVLLSIYLFGGHTIEYFVLALLVGIIVGTYSSIFVASPLLVTYYNRFIKK